MARTTIRHDLNEALAFIRGVTISGARHGLPLVLASVFAAIPSGVSAIVETGQLSLSPDITITIAGLASPLEDEDLLLEDKPNPRTFEDLGPLSKSVDLTGYEKLLNGDRLLSLDTTVSLSGSGGPFSAEPRDVVLFDGMDYSLDFDGSASGVPETARIDALGQIQGDLVLSFDTTATLGGQLTASDEDLVRVLGGGQYLLLFDGSAAGVPSQLDLDAFHVRSDDGVLFSLLLSFDVAGSVGGIRFDDEDILEYRQAGGIWTLAFDASAEHPNWSPADLDALYFPPECSDGIDNDANGDIDFPADAGCDSPGDEVEFMAWTFSGKALGGAIFFTVNGVALQVITMAGQTAAQVAQLVVDAINADGNLMGLGVSAAVHGDRVTTNGTVTDVVVNDPGLGHNAAEVPGLLLWGLLAVAAALLGTGVTRSPKVHGGEKPK